MANKYIELAENKLIILFLLYQIDMPLTTAQLVDFAVQGDYMDYFACQQYIAELADNGMIASDTNENNATIYTITDEGDETLRLFYKQIPYSRRTAICDYVKENKKRIKREFEVVANYFYNSDDDYTVKCGVYEDEKPLMEINLSVVSLEQAKAVKRNWKNNVTELYGIILSTMLDDQTGEKMREELKADFADNHVINDNADEE